jgi:hypothetical protein
MSCERYQAATEILEILYDRAVNRYLEQSNFDIRDHLTDEELRQYEAAEAVELDHNSILLANSKPSHTGRTKEIDRHGGMTNELTARWRAPRSS